MGERGWNGRMSAMENEKGRDKEHNNLLLVSAEPTAQLSHHFPNSRIITIALNRHMQNINTFVLMISILQGRIWCNEEVRKNMIPYRGGKQSEHWRYRKLM